MSAGATTLGVAMTDLDDAVARIAEATLADQQFVTPVDLLIGLGWLVDSSVHAWLGGLVTSLDRCLRVDETEAADALTALQRWARRHGLKPWETDYAGLHFTAGGRVEDERRFRTRWARDEHPAPKTPPPRCAQPNILAAERTWECNSCGGEPTDPLLRVKAGGICLDCTGLGHLVFLPSGDANLTRRTAKASGVTGVVYRMNTPRRRYERQGILAEQCAVELAARQCLEDDDLTPRRLRVDDALRREIADHIRAQFPGCPPLRAEAIAFYAAVRGRARRNRGNAADPGSVLAAVTNSVRRIDTDYERLLLTGLERADAERAVQIRVDDILRTWTSGATLLD